MARKALGRGLKALIAESEDRAIAAESGEISSIALEDIRPNPYQPRTEFDESELEELAASIREHGVLQPVVVRRSGSSYELVVGERRFRAARMAGLEEVPAIIKDVDSRQMMELALVENLQRSDLNAIEEARAFHRLLTEFGLTHEEIAEVVGKRRSTVSNSLRLLSLPEEVQKMISSGELSGGHAKALLAVSDSVVQLQIARRIINENLSVRETERLAASAGTRKRVPRGTSRSSRSSTDPELVEVEERMARVLGTKVRIKPIRGRGKGKHAGRIEIEYYSDDDVSRIVEIILAAQ